MFKLKIKSISARFLLYVVLVFHSLVILIPLIIMILNSFKNNKDIFTKSPLSLPNVFKFENYSDLFSERVNFIIFFRNSVFVTVSSIIILLVISSLCAYALAKYKFPLYRLVYFYFIIGLFIPVRLGTINIAQIMLKVSLYNNLFSLIIIYTAIGIPFALFILTDFIRMIPEELSNSARVDGCSEIGIFLKIILPLIRPALVTVTIFNIIWIWNDFWFPLILIRDDNLKTIPFATAKFVTVNLTEYGSVYAVLTIAALPMILVYLALSRYYIQGITSGAIKG